MRPPLLTRTDLIEIETLLRLHWKQEDGQRLSATLERLLRDRDVSKFDAGTLEFQRQEAKDARVALAAAIMSTQERQIRIARVAIENLRGPGEFSIVELEDPTTREMILRVVSHVKR